MTTFTPLASSSAANAYLLKCEGYAPLLIDCGLPFEKLQAALGYKVGSLAGCIVSHQHRDHCAALPALTRASVPCYALKSVWDSFEGVRSPVIACWANVIPSSREMLTIGAWTVHTFPVPHDVETLGFFILSPDGKDRALYLTDAGFVPHTFENLSVLCIEANHSRELVGGKVVSGRTNSAHARRVLTNHLSLESLVKFLDAQDLSSLREVHLLHLSDSNSDAEAFRAVIQAKTGAAVYVAGKGMA